MKRTNGTPACRQAGTDKRTTKLIVALDVDSSRRVKELVNLFYPKVKFFKVGSQLFTACGPKIIDWIHQKRAKVFLDLKFHDIPHSVAQSAKIATRMGVFMFNLHAQGGREMMQQAKEAAERESRCLKIKRPLIVAVTVLTSQQDKETTIRVLELARDVKEAGLDGVVASVNEVGLIRQAMGEKFIIVTPGIRLSTISLDDQRRVATPAEAKAKGVDFIVAGRPLLETKEPLSVLKDILRQLR